jgi:hypothetical protein
MPIIQPNDLGCKPHPWIITSIDKAIDAAIPKQLIINDFKASIEATFLSAPSYYLQRGLLFTTRRRKKYVIISC